MHIGGHFFLKRPPAFSISVQAPDGTLLGWSHSVIQFLLLNR